VKPILSAKGVAIAHPRDRIVGSSLGLCAQIVNALGQLMGGMAACRLFYDEPRIRKYNVHNSEYREDGEQ
jgi:hypothetical protein